MTSIRKSLSSGIFYTGAAKYSGVLISLVIGAVLARLLTPEEFGIVAIVTVFVTFFNLLSNFGIGPAVVQNGNLSDNDISSIFSFSIILGFFFASLFFLMAPLIASFYDELVLINITRLLSIAILFYSFQVVPYALSQKKLRFKYLGIISVSIQIFSGVIAILLAFRGFSYYALVFKSIFDSIATFMAFFWLSPIKITFVIKFKAIRKIARFSSFQFMFNFINYFSRNLDNLLIGKYFSPASLGYYEKSYRLMTLPVSNLTHVISPVLLPVLSEFQHDKLRIYNSYVKIVRLLATIGFPLSVFLFFSASEIIHIIYGPQWEQSVPVFKLLATTVGIQIVLSSSGSIFQTLNRTDLLFYSGLISAVFMLSGITYGVFIGESLISVGYGLILAFCINFFQGFYILIKIALKSSLINFLKVFIFPLILSSGMGIGLFITSKHNFDNNYYSLGLKLLISILIFGLIFICSSANRQFLTKIITKIIKRN